MYVVNYILLNFSCSVGKLYLDQRTDLTDVAVLTSRFFNYFFNFNICEDIKSAMVEDT